jgi:uncharacterized protein with GYD domain
MSKYLIQGNYTAEGIKGLIKDGGSARKEAVEKLARAVGGTLESINFSSAGSIGYVVVMSLPDRAAAAAISAAVIASGALSVTQSVELLTPAEMDEAAKKVPDYRAPGR